jgi:hypothetical protein
MLANHDELLRLKLPLATHTVSYSCALSTLHHRCQGNEAARNSSTHNVVQDRKSNANGRNILPLWHRH